MCQYFLFLMICFLVTASKATASDLSEPLELAPMLAIHSELPEQEHYTLRTERMTIYSRIKNLPHPKITTMEAFNTVTDFGFKVFYVLWGRR
jgi:hypothetical protein